MEFTEETAKTVGDKELKHYFEVAVLKVYWKKGDEAQVSLLEEEMKRRGQDPDEARRVLMVRTPELDQSLEALWAGKLYLPEKDEKDGDQ